MVELAAVRDGVLRWAVLNGILAEASLSDEGARSGDETMCPFSEHHAEFFRTRKIVRVFSAGSTLRISARLKIAKPKIKILEEAFKARYGDEGLKLEVGTSRPFTVDQTIDAFGELVPLHRTGADILSCGSSIGLGNQRNAGTLTAIARLNGGDPTRLFGLSCNHVIGGCSTALPGTPVVMPGIQDVSTDIDEINLVGRLYEIAPMSQGLPSVIQLDSNSDLAAFEIDEHMELSSMQGSGTGSYDTPTSFARQIRKGLAVKKWGRSTGLSHGHIDDVVEGGYPLPYKVTSYYGPQHGASQIFRGTVYYNKAYEVVPSGVRPFSLGGDSGALVTTDKPNQPERIVGIVVAGGKEKGLVLPLRPMLRHLKMTIVSGMFGWHGAHPRPRGRRHGDRHRRVQRHSGHDRLTAYDGVVSDRTEVGPEVPRMMSSLPKRRCS